MVQLAHQGLQLVAAVPVQQHELANTLPLQRINQVCQNVKQSRRRHAAC